MAGNVCKAILVGHGGLPSLEHAFIVLINSQHRSLELRGAQGLARLTLHPSHVTGRAQPSFPFQLNEADLSVAQPVSGLGVRAPVCYSKLVVIPVKMCKYWEALVRGAYSFVVKPTNSKHSVADNGGVEALDGMLRRAAAGFATSTLAMVAARARVGDAAEAEELAADLRAAAAVAGTSKNADPTPLKPAASSFWCSPRLHSSARHVIFFHHPSIPSIKGMTWMMMSKL